MSVYTLGGDNHAQASGIEAQPEAAPLGSTVLDSTSSRERGSSSTRKKVSHRPPTPAPTEKAKRDATNPAEGGDNLAKAR